MSSFAPEVLGETAIEFFIINYSVFKVRLNFTEPPENLFRKRKLKHFVL